MVIQSAFHKLCEEAKQHVKEIDFLDVNYLMDTEQLPILIDVREESEWHKGHLPHAIHLSRGIIEGHIEAVIPNRQAVIIVYCAAGYRSLLVAESLAKMGYDNVYSMAGGFYSWQTSNLLINYD